MSKTLNSCELALKKPRQLIEQNHFAHANIIQCTDGFPGIYSALALAKQLLCNNPTSIPCNDCNSCKLFDQFSHPDLHFSFPYIKSGSQNTSCEEYMSLWKGFLKENLVFVTEDWQQTIESGNKQLQIYTAEGQRLLKNLSLKPYSSVNKVLILWQPELLNNSTSNKLLKFIEEPYDNTFVIMVSHKLENVLGTILSRCQIINLHDIDNTEINNDIKQLSLAQDVEILKIAQGNLGLYSNLITHKEDLKSIGNQFLSWLRAAYSLKVKDLLTFSESLAKENREQLLGVLHSFLEHFRTAFLINSPTISTTCLVDLTKLSQFIHEENIDLIYTEVQKLESNLHRNANAKIVLFDSSIKIGQLLRK